MIKVNRRKCTRIYLDEKNLIHIFQSKRLCCRCDVTEQGLVEMYIKLNRPESFKLVVSENSIEDAHEVLLRLKWEGEFYYSKDLPEDSYYMEDENENIIYSPGA